MTSWDVTEDGVPQRLSVETDGLTLGDPISHAQGSEPSLERSMSWHEIENVSFPTNAIVHIELFQYAPITVAFNSATELSDFRRVLESERSQTSPGRAASQSRLGTTRVCPFCAETIKAQAVKCRYCQSELRPEPAAGIAQPRAEIPPRVAKAGSGPFRVAALFFGLAAFTLMYGFVWSDRTQGHPPECLEWNLDGTGVYPPYCSEEMPLLFPTGSVIFAAIFIAAALVFVLIWAIGRGVQEGTSAS